MNRTGCEGLFAPFRFWSDVSVVYIGLSLGNRDVTYNVTLGVQAVNDRSEFSIRPLDWVSISPKLGK